jgi:hypothetical protein
VIRETRKVMLLIWRIITRKEQNTTPGVLYARGHTHTHTHTHMLSVTIIDQDSRRGHQCTPVEEGGGNFRDIRVHSVLQSEHQRWWPVPVREK